MKFKFVTFIVCFILLASSRQTLCSEQSINKETVSKDRNNEIIFISSALETIQPNGQGRKTLCSMANSIFSYSAKAQKILFSSGRKTIGYNAYYLLDIKTLDLKTGAIQTLYRAKENESIGFATYSPKGTKILTLIWMLDKKGAILEYQLRLLNEGEQIWKTIMIVPNKNIYYALMANWTPDGKSYVYIDRFNKLVAQSLDSNKSKELIPKEKYEAIGEWDFSPDGEELVFEASPHHGDPFMHIYLLNLKKGEISEISPPEDTCGDPQWSPDGKYIAYRSYEDKGLYIYSRESKIWHNIIIWPGDNRHKGCIDGLTWNPLGTELVVSHSILCMHAERIPPKYEPNDGWRGLFIIDIPSGKIRPLLNASIDSESKLIWHIDKLIR